MKFRHLYAWHVMPQMEKGEKVYVLDRKAREVSVVNDMMVSEAVELIKLADGDESDRFDFWIEEEEENA